MRTTSSVVASSLLTAVLAAICAPSRAAVPAPEPEPVLTTADFKGLPPLTGAGYRIDPAVPVTGYLGQFTVKTDLGDVGADGVELLHQRVKEVKAASELDEMSTSDVFVKALGQSASQGAQAVGQAVQHPVDTMKNVPTGIGRLFGSIRKDVSDTVSDGSSGASSVSDSMGVGKARRQLAHKVGVDPYTSNPLVSKRLDDLSKAAFAGGVSIDVVFAVASGGAATAVSFTRTVSNLAWELPPEDIRARNQTNLAAMGVGQSTSDVLLNNRTYTPTLALAFVEALKALEVKDGANDFTQLAAGAASETEARFYIDQLRMAGVYKKSERIDRLEVSGKIGVMRSGERLFVPLPVDYLSWTEGVKAAVESPRFEARERIVWLTGELSRRAHEGLRETHWTVREHAPVE